MHITGIFSQNDRLQRAKNGAQAGSKETLTHTLNSLVGLEADEGPVEVAFYYGSFQANDLQLPLNSAAQVGNSSRQIACNPKANRLEGVVTLAIEMAIPPPHSVLHHLQGIVLASLLALRKDERKKA